MDKKLVLIVLLVLALFLPVSFKPILNEVYAQTFFGPFTVYTDTNSLSARHDAQAHVTWDGTRFIYVWGVDGPWAGNGSREHAYYQTSTDGASWTSPIKVSGAARGLDFEFGSTDVWVDDSEFLLFMHGHKSGSSTPYKFRVQNGTILSNGTITFQNQTTFESGDYMWAGGIAKAADGYNYYFAYQHFNNTAPDHAVRIRYSPTFENTFADWSETLVSVPGINSSKGGLNILPMTGANMMVVVHTSNDSLAYSTGATNSFSALSYIGTIDEGYGRFHATRDDDGVIHLIYLNGSDPYYRFYSGVAWSAPIQLDADAGSNAVTLGIADDLIFAVWLEGGVIYERNSEIGVDCTAATQPFGSSFTTPEGFLSSPKRETGLRMPVVWREGSSFSYMMGYMGSPVDPGPGNGGITAVAMNWWLMLVGFVCFVSPPFVIAKRRYGEAANVIILLFVMVIGLALIGSAVS